MPAKKISALTALGARPATNDLVPLVDVSDVTDAASGTTKKMTVANLFDAPTMSDFTNANHDHTDADDGGQLTDAALSAAVGIAKGGTGQTTATAAFDALAPTTTQGDMIYHNGSDNIRLAKGTTKQFLQMNSGATAPEWTTPVFFYQQEVPTSTNEALTSTEYTFGSMTDGSAFFVLINNTSVIYRFERDTNTGAYLETHTVNMGTDIPGSDNGAIINIGLYIYVFTNDGTNIICWRYLAADLTGEQAMTVPTIPCTSTIGAWTDGSAAYVVSKQSDTTSRKWSVSGTTFSAVSTATVTTAKFAEPESGSMWDGTTAYCFRRSSGNIVIEKLTNIDGSVRSTTTKALPLISDTTVGSLLINIDTNKMYMGYAYGIYDEAAITNSLLKLVPVTKP